MPTASRRHIQASDVEYYLAQGVNGVLDVPGDPVGAVVVDAVRGLVGTRIAFAGPMPDASGLANVLVESFEDGGVLYQQVLIRLQDNTEEILGVCQSLLDRVQLGGETVNVAFDEVLRSLEGILAARRGLTKDQQLGLFGELLVLGSLVLAEGPNEAVASWHGPDQAEHDFALSQADLEVKSTLGERRAHWISSATQLLPTGARPLYLVSLQMTAAPPAGGLALPELVSFVSDLCGPASHQLVEKLDGVGYRSSDEALYRWRWMLRSDGACYLVDSQFPAVTTPMLEQVVPSSQRVVALRYQLDLSDLDESSWPFPSSDLLAV